MKERHGRQLGDLNAIINTAGRFIISAPKEIHSLAIQVSRNLFQYFGADAELMDPDQIGQPGEGNRISLLLGLTDHASLLAGQPNPIFLDKTRGLVVRDARGRTSVYGFEKGLCAIFLQPRGTDALELVIWGSDVSGLRTAARLVPMLTGVGQPDFVILNQGCASKGVAGIHALGFFDNFWNISDGSVVL